MVIPDPVCSQPPQWATGCRKVTVNPIPLCAITGTDGPVCPGSSNVFSGPAGMSSYSWNVSGNGTTSGALDQPSVTVIAGPNCDQTFTVTLNIADAIGCTSQCEKTVNVTASQNPQWAQTMPANVTVDCQAIPVVPTILATGDCNVEVVYSQTGTYDACGGTLTRTWTATNDCGNSIIHSQTITVSAAAPAAFATVADIEVACGAATTSSLSYTNGLDGTCEISGSVTSTLSALPTTYCGGDVTETWSFTDLCGRTISTSRTITVLPAAPAVFATVADIEVACGAATTSSLSYTNGLDGDCQIAVRSPRP